MHVEQIGDDRYQITGDVGETAMIRDSLIAQSQAPTEWAVTGLGPEMRDSVTVAIQKRNRTLISAVGTFPDLPGYPSERAKR